MPGPGSRCRWAGKQGEGRGERGEGRGERGEGRGERKRQFMDEGNSRRLVGS
jgi:hypothetical protein